VAALFVDPRGPYPILLADVWPIERDARRYAGSAPVVAHPPCQLWTNLAYVNFKRWGGEHNRPGNDGGCFAAALASVRQCGGVLEHPAFSHAWDAYRLGKPGALGWRYVGDREWVCEVWQSAYGHRARKRTWLLYVGLVPPAELRWDRKPGTHQCGFFDRIKPVISKRLASETPLEFARALIDLAKRSALGS